MILIPCKASPSASFQRTLSLLQSLRTVVWRSLAATAAAASVATSLATPAPAPTGHVPITLNGPGPYYRMALPMAIYSLSRDPDLADLRIQDSQGHPLPWTWAPEVDTLPSQLREVPFFAVPGGLSGQAQMPAILTVLPNGAVQWKSGKSGATEQASKAAVSTWILDLHAIKGSVMALHLRWKDSDEGVFALRLEASDDLQNWHSLVDNGSVLRLSSQGETLLQNDIALDGEPARYMRLSWLGQPLTILGVQANVLDDSESRPGPMQWTAFWPANSCTARSCSWTSPAQLPIDAVRVQLRQGNTLAYASLSGEQTVSTTSSPRRRNPLYELRYRHRPKQPAVTTESYSLWSGVLWRLSLPTKPQSAQNASQQSEVSKAQNKQAEAMHSESTQGELVLGGQNFSKLILHARGHTRELGAVAPLLSLGTRTRVMVFLTRDAAPVSLVWGQSKSAGSALDSMAQLMPLGKQTHTDTASVHLGQLRQAPVSPAAAIATADANTPSQAPWLWAALVGGLLLLGLMAVSLLKSTKAPPKAD